MKVTVVVLDAGFSDFGDSSPNKIDVVLTKCFEITRTRCQSATAWRIRRLQRLIDPWLFLQFLLHGLVGHFPEDFLNLRAFKSHQLTFVHYTLDVVTVAQIFVWICGKSFPFLDRMFDYHLSGFGSCETSV